MANNNTLMSREIKEIASKKTDFKRLFSATILAGGQEIKALSVTRLDIRSDFENNYRDDIAVTLLLPLGTVLENIAPYQDDLVIYLKETIVGEYDYIINEYNAYLMEDLPNDIERSADPVFRDTEKSNRTSTINITFSLTSPIIKKMDAVHTGGVILNEPVYKIILILFEKYLGPTSPTRVEGLQDITMVEPSNVEPRAQTIIPHNTRLVHIPQIMQDQMGGVYSGGMGFYLQMRSLYFWGIYDTEKGRDIKNRLHIYCPTSIHSISIENTYKREGRIISIVASNKPRIQDDTLGQSFLEGDSVRYADGNKAFEPVGKIVGDEIIADRRSRNIETGLVDVSINSTSISGYSSHFTSNVFKEMERKARINGIYVYVEWRYSSHYLIRPGMLTSIYMYNGDDIIEVEGLVMAVTSKYELERDGINENTLLPSSVITVFVKREEFKMKKFISSGTQRNIKTTM